MWVQTSNGSPTVTCSSSALPIVARNWRSHRESSQYPTVRRFSVHTQKVLWNPIRTNECGAHRAQRCDSASWWSHHEIGQYLSFSFLCDILIVDHYGLSFSCILDLCLYLWVFNKAPRFFLEVMIIYALVQVRFASC